MLQSHKNLGHVSFERIRELSRQGDLSKKYLSCSTPACAAYLYSKAMRRKWKTKTNDRDINLEQPRTLEPGECISSDMVMSPTPGSIAQMSGKLTTVRYTCAKIYVDVASKFGYLVLPRTASATETLRGKQKFEDFSHSVGVKITGYHANSGTFRANKWQDSCRLQRQ